MNIQFHPFSVSHNLIFMIYCLDLANISGNSVFFTRKEFQQSAIVQKRKQPFYNFCFACFRRNAHVILSRRKRKCGNMGDMLHKIVKKQKKGVFPPGPSRTLIIPILNMKCCSLLIRQIKTGTSLISQTGAMQSLLVGVALTLTNFEN